MKSQSRKYASFNANIILKWPLDFRCIDDPADTICGQP